MIFQAHNLETRQHNSATWVQIKLTAHCLHLYSPEPLSDHTNLLRLYSDANGSKWKKDMEWCEAHDKDDPIPQSSTGDSMDFTQVFLSMLSIYPIIDWRMLLAYCPLQNCWHNFYSAPNPLTGSSLPIFLILIGSISLIFCKIL